MTEPSPPAHRLARPRWLELRTVCGLLLVVLAVVIGARVFASADRYSEVYLARRDLVPGQQLTASDLAVGRVRFDGEGGGYIAAGHPPQGYVVTRFVSAGELVPVTAVASQPQAVRASRLVSVPVADGHLPVGLGRGDEVDVYVTTKTSGGDVKTPLLVMSAAVVDTVEGAGDLSGSDTASVVLVVPVAKVAAVVGAAESGQLDLVRLPSLVVMRAATVSR